MNVADVVVQLTNGTWTELRRLLLQNIMTVIERVLGNRTVGDDSPIWRRSSHGDFSVKTAYENLMSPVYNGDSDLWRAVWKLKIPQRCQTFLWLALRGRLLTNVFK